MPPVLRRAAPRRCGCGCRAYLTQLMPALIDDGTQYEMFYDLTEPSYETAAAGLAAAVTDLRQAWHAAGFLRITDHCGSTPAARTRSTARSPTSTSHAPSARPARRCRPVTCPE